MNAAAILKVGLIFGVVRLLHPGRLLKLTFLVFIFRININVVSPPDLTPFHRVETFPIEGRVIDRVEDEIGVQPAERMMEDIVDHFIIAIRAANRRDGFGPHIENLTGMGGVIVGR